MNRRTCSICGKKGHNKRTCTAPNRNNPMISVSSGSETLTDNESKEITVIPETQSPQKTPPKTTPKKTKTKTPPEAKEIIRILNNDKKMLEEMTANFEFDPSNSSAEERKEMAKTPENKQQQKQPTQKNPKEKQQEKQKSKSQSKTEIEKQQKRMLPPRAARTQAAEQIKQQLTKNEKTATIDLSLKEGSCGATSRASRFSRSKSRTPSPHQQRQTKGKNSPNQWRQRNRNVSPGPSNANVNSARSQLYHHSVSPPRPQFQQQQEHRSHSQHRRNSNQLDSQQNTNGYNSPLPMTNNSARPQMQNQYGQFQQQHYGSPHANMRSQPFHMTPPYNPFYVSPIQNQQQQFQFMQPQYHPYMAAPPRPMMPQPPAYASPPQWQQQNPRYANATATATTATAASPTTPITIPDSPPQMTPPAKASIVRPNDSTLVQLHSQGVNTVYAVAWEGGGGIYIAEAEANPARYAMMSIGKQTSVVIKLNTAGKDIFANIADADTRIRNWNASPSSTHDLPVRESSASMPTETTTGAHDIPSAGTPQSQQTSTQHSSRQPTPQSYSKPATPSPPKPSSSPATPPPPTAATPTAATPATDLISETEWAFSQEDQLVRKHLFSPGLKPFSRGIKQPDPNKIQYIAPPGSSRGIIINDLANGLQRIVMDASTGTMMVKPKHMATLPLLEFHTFLSLMFRAVDMANQGTTVVHRSAPPAIRNLIRRLIRQYEALRWANEHIKLWDWIAYLTWTHFILTRTETEGFQWEAAFEREARARLKRSNLGGIKTSLSNAVKPKSTASTTTWQIWDRGGVTGSRG